MAVVMNFKKDDLSQLVWMITSHYREKLQPDETVELVLSAFLVDGVDNGDTLIAKNSEVYSRAAAILEKSGENNPDSQLKKSIKDAAFTKESRIQAADILMQELDENKFSASTLTTPESVAKVVYRLLNIEKEDSLYDIGSGYGKVLAFMTEYARGQGNDAFRAVGIEANERLVQISKMLLALHCAHYEIKEKDIFSEQTANQYTKAYVYPPVGARYGMTFIEKMQAEYGSRISTRTSPEWFFVLKAVQGMTGSGQLAAFIPEGALFRSSDKEIRKYLMHCNLLQGVIALPSRLIRQIGSRMYLLILGQSDGTFKMVDAADAMVTNSRKDIILDVDKIVNAYFNPDVATYSYSEAAAKDYCLNVSAYAAGEAESLIDCPERISDVAKIIVGTQYTLAHFKKDPAEEKTDYQILTSSNIENGIINYDSLYYIKPDKALDKYELHTGDVVMTAKSTIIKTAVVSDLPKRHVIVTGGMIIIRPQADRLNPTYLKMFFDSKTGKKILSSVQKGSVIITISISAFKELDIACPPIEKQTALANRYNVMLEMYHALQKQMDTLKIQIDTLYDDSTGEN